MINFKIGGSKIEVRKVLCLMFCLFCFACVLCVSCFVLSLPTPPVTYMKMNK